MGVRRTLELSSLALVDIDTPQRPGLLFVTALAGTSQIPSQPHTVRVPSTNLSSLVTFRCSHTTSCGVCHMPSRTFAQPFVTLGQGRTANIRAPEIYNRESFRVRARLSAQLPTFTHHRVHQSVMFCKERNEPLTSNHFGLVISANVNIPSVRFELGKIFRLTSSGSGASTPPAKTTNRQATFGHLRQSSFFSSMRTKQCEFRRTKDEKDDDGGEYSQKNGQADRQLNVAAAFGILVVKWNRIQLVSTSLKRRAKCILLKLDQRLFRNYIILGTKTGISRNTAVTKQCGNSVEDLGKFTWAMPSKLSKPYFVSVQHLLQEIFIRFRSRHSQGLRSPRERNIPEDRQLMLLVCQQVASRKQSAVMLSASGSSAIVLS